MSSRLPRILSRLLRPARTLSTGVVAGHVRQGEVRIAGRSERVLVAGPAMPPVGATVALVALDSPDSGLLVTFGARRSGVAYPWPAAGGKWRAEIAALAGKGREFGQFRNVTPAVAASDASTLWSFLYDTSADPDRRLMILKGAMAQALEAAGWAEAAGWDFDAFPGHTPSLDHTGGPAEAGAAFLLDGSKLVFWWHLDYRLWADDRPTSGVEYGAVATINPDGTVSAGTPTDLPFPSIAGFGPFEGGGSCGIAKGPDGRYWLVATHGARPPSIVGERLYGADFPAGANRYYRATCESGTGQELSLTHEWEAELISYPSYNARGGPYGGANPVADGGGFTYKGPPGGGSYAYYFVFTYYKADSTSGDGESAPGGYPGGTYVFWVAESDPNGYSLEFLLNAGLRNCTGRRIYCRQGLSGSYYQVHEQAGNAQEWVHVDAPATSGPTAPGSSTLPMCRGWIRDVTPGPPGTAHRTIYRASSSGGPWQKIGEIAGNTWPPWTYPTEGLIDTNLPASGDPPPRQAYLQRAVVVGRTVDPGTFAGGVTWEVVESWADVPDELDDPRAATFAHFQNTAILPLADGRVVALYGNAEGGISGKVRSAAGAWSARQNLTAEPAYDFRVGALLNYGGQYLVALWRCKPDGTDPSWRRAALTVDGTTLTLDQATTISAGDGERDRLVRLTALADPGALLLTGLDASARAYQVEGAVEEAAEPLALAAPFPETFTAPAAADGPDFAALGTDYPDTLIVVKWSAE